MKLSAIYKIQSIINPERIYIGSSVNITDRWINHLKELRKNKHGSHKLQNHYNKYFESDLVFIIIEPCFPQFLIIREQYYIDILKPYFNECKVAGSPLGTKHSEETIQKMRGRTPPNKGKKMSPECKEKHRIAMMGNKNAVGHKPSESTLLKLREANKGNKYAVGIQYWLNKTLSKEHKQHLKDAWKLRKLKLIRD